MLKRNPIEQLKQSLRVFMFVVASVTTLGAGFVVAEPAYAQDDGRFNPNFDLTDETKSQSFTSVRNIYRWIISIVFYIMAGYAIGAYVLGWGMKAVGFAAGFIVFVGLIEVAGRYFFDQSGIKFPGVAS